MAFTPDRRTGAQDDAPRRCAPHRDARTHGACARVARPIAHPSLPGCAIGDVLPRPRSLPPASSPYACTMLRIKERTLPPVPALKPFTLSEAVRGAVRTPHHDAHRREGGHSVVRTRAGVNRAESVPLAGERRSSRTAHCTGAHHNAHRWHRSGPSDLLRGGARPMTSITDRPARTRSSQGEIGHPSAVTVRPRTRGASSRWVRPVRKPACGPDNRRPGHQAGESEDTVPAPDRPAPSRRRARPRSWSPARCRLTVRPGRAYRVGCWASPGEALPPALAFPLPKPLPCPAPAHPAFPLVTTGLRARAGSSQPSSLPLSLSWLSVVGESIGSGGPVPSTAGGRRPAAGRSRTTGGRA